MAHFGEDGTSWAKTIFQEYQNNDENNNVQK